MPHERAILLLFCHPTLVGGRRPLPPLMGDRSDPPALKNRSRRQMYACNVSTVRASEKSSIMTNRKSYTGFPTSYRWSAYVTSKSAKGWLKKRTFRNVIVHSFPYLTVHRWHRCWGNTNPSTPNVASKWGTTYTKRWIGDISACSSSAVTASEMFIYHL